MITVAGVTAAAGTELGWGLMVATALYFAPTLLALARRREAAPLTFSFNLLLGWTGVGWVVAWVLAFADRRLNIHVNSPTPIYPQLPSSSVTLAPDGRHWWDGSAWRDGWRVAPSGALRSPDGARWYTGTQWIPSDVPVAVRVPPPGPSVGLGDSLHEPQWWRLRGSDRN
jgi:hypothetical protein